MSTRTAPPMNVGTSTGYHYNCPKKEGMWIITRLRRASSVTFYTAVCDQCGRVDDHAFFVHDHNGEPRQSGYTLGEPPP